MILFTLNMANGEESPGQAMPIEDAEAAAVTQPPLAELQVETTVLDSEQPHLLELGEQLEAVARRVIRKGDEATAYSQYRASRRMGIFTSLGSVEGFLSTIISAHGTTVGGVGFCIGAVGAAVFQTKLDKHAAYKVAPVQIPEGYSVQCLRANQDSPAFNRREAIAFVHTRRYPEGRHQTADQARDRLRDALTVVDAAPTVAKVVLPSAALREAQLPYQAGKDYTDTILDLKLDAWVDGQYPGHETAVVLTRERAKQMAEALNNMQSYPLLKHALAALAERFPLACLQLAEVMDDDEKLVPLLHTLLRRSLDGELPSAQRERGHEIVLRAARTGTPSGSDTKENGAGRHRAEPALAPTKPRFTYKHVYYDRLAPLVTQTDTAAKRFDPLITQRLAANYAPVESRRLSDMAGGEELMDEIAMRLQDRGYSDMQLLAVALRLVERRQKERLEGDPDETPEPQPEPTMAGGDPINIYVDLANWHPARSQQRARSVGRVAAGAMLGIFLAQGVITGAHAVETSLPKLPAVISQGDLTWRVDEHGMSSAGYYTQEMSNHYDAAAVRWDGLDGFKWTNEPLPIVLADPTEDHLTLSTITNSSDVDLPIHQGTRLETISARAANGAELLHMVSIRGDSTRQVHVDNKGQDYQLTYDLVNDPHSERVQFADRTLSVTDAAWNKFDVTALPGDKRTLYTLADYISNNFTYDASVHTRDKLKADHTASSYVATVYSNGGRANCVEAATAAALVENRLHPDLRVELGHGYFNNQVTQAGGHSYLESSKLHDWLVDGDGEIIDATPHKTDKNSNVPQHESTDQIDSRMKDGGWSQAAHAANNDGADAATAANQKGIELKDLEEMARMGVGMVAAGLLWREVRTRTIARIALRVARTSTWMASAAMIHPGKAATVMAWHDFGGERALPAYDAARPVPVVDNISTDALHEIANGGLRSDPRLGRVARGGIRQMARLLLAERQAQHQPAHRKSKHHAAHRKS